MCVRVAMGSTHRVKAKRPSSVITSCAPAANEHTTWRRWPAVIVRLGERHLTKAGLTHTRLKRERRSIRIQCETVFATVDADELCGVYLCTNLQHHATNREGTTGNNNQPEAAAPITHRTSSKNDPNKHHIEQQQNNPLCTRTA